MVVLYRPTYITVDYEDLDHYHCRLLTPGIGYGIRAPARSLYSVVVGLFNWLYAYSKMLYINTCASACILYTNPIKQTNTQTKQGDTL